MLKRKIKMSAAEMLCFSRYLGVMVGDLVPYDFPLWEIWKKLREILDIVTAPNLHFSEHIRLGVVIEEYLRLIANYCKTLKPKHHHLTHYSLAMKMSGPLVNLWSMRFEQKHKESKMTSNVSCNFRNITHTLAVKAQLKLAHHLAAPITKEYVEFGDTLDLSEQLQAQFFNLYQKDNIF